MCAGLVNIVQVDGTCRSAGGGGLYMPTDKYKPTPCKPCQWLSLRYMWCTHSYDVCIKASTPVKLRHKIHIVRLYYSSIKGIGVALGI